MRKKITQISLIIIINIFIMLLLIFLSDIAVYSYHVITYRKNHADAFKPPFFSYLIKPRYGIDFKTYFDGSDNVFRGRKPDGLEYKNKEPIIIFGCSYAHGQFLKYNQTFSYKLAHILKRPVYNRAVPGRGIGCMYWQSIDDNFYSSVPPSNTVLYVIIPDHYRRLYINFIDILDTHMTGHFNKKGNDLILDGSNYLKNILISSYSFKVLNSKYVNWYINNPKYEDEITDLVLLYFLKTRENLEKHWNKKINFTIIFYNNYKLLYSESLYKKLKANNFNVIETDKLSNVNLNSKEYLNPDNGHPTEKTWDLLTPLIAERLK